MLLKCFHPAYCLYFIKNILIEYIVKFMINQNKQFNTHILTKKCTMRRGKLTYMVHEFSKLYVAAPNNETARLQLGYTKLCCFGWLDCKEKKSQRYNIVLKLNHLFTGRQTRQMSSYYITLRHEKFWVGTKVNNKLKGRTSTTLQMRTITADEHFDGPIHHLKEKRLYWKYL